MGIESNSLSEVEQERLRQAQALAAESGPKWQEPFRPGSAGCHELLDRASLVADLVQRHLLGHPACVARPDWYLLAEQTAAALRALYQKVRAEHLAFENPGVLAFKERRFEPLNGRESQ